MTRVRINLTLHVHCASTAHLGFCFALFTVKSSFNVQFAQEQGKYACVVVQLLLAELPPPAPALWRGLPTCAVLQCPAGVARLQCHSDQQLEKKQWKETMEIMTYYTYLKMIMRLFPCINVRLNNKSNYSRTLIGS